MSSLDKSGYEGIIKLSIMNLYKNKLQILVSIAFLGFLGWWFSFQSVVTQQGTSVKWFSGTDGLVALAGAVIGYAAARKWGGFKTVLGKSLMFFSIGLFAQEAGQLIYTYYVYGSNIQIPYPSWGDVAYFGSTVSYIIGAYYLAKAAGIKFSLKSAKYKLIAIIVPVALLATSYGVLLHNHQYDTSKPITVFLDFGYPMGEAVYISLAIVALLLSRKLLGGVMRAGIILIIIALAIQYASDSNFIYQSSRGTYLGGQYADLLYLIAYYAMSIAMIKFHKIYNGLRQQTAERRETAKSGVDS
jgi:hypothetical protein